MTRRVRRATMADVAKASGVSTMTVSRVINGHPSVTEETKARVRVAIDDLDYRADVAARMLAGGRSHVLGVISIQPGGYGPTVSLYAIESAARAAGQLVSFITVADPTVANLATAVDSLRSAHAEGIVVIARVDSAIESLAALQTSVPIVVIAAEGSTEDFVAVDQEMGGRLATRHLLELGHATVHHVRGPRRWVDADARAHGWRRELKAQRRPAGRCVIGDWTPESGYAAGQELAADPDVTAIFVANDNMAVGLLLALDEAGRRVPEDVSVIGFDDIPVAGFLKPPLTTIRQPFDALARAAVDQVLMAIDGEPHSNVSITPRVVLRDSTAAPTS